MYFNTLVIRGDYITTFIKFPLIDVSIEELEELIRKYDHDGYSNLYKEVTLLPRREWWRITVDDGFVEEEMSSHSAGHSWQLSECSSLEEAIEYYFAC